MRTLFFFFLLSMTAVAEAQDRLPPAGDIRAAAEPAVAVLEPVADTLQYLKLPDLEFVLSIEPRCAPGTDFRSVLVSVADTRLWLGRGDLGDAAVLQALLQLPRPQTGQLRADKFCRTGGDNDDARLEIGDALTARLSLRCGNEDRESVAYATLPLEIVLECRTGMDSDEPEAPPAHSTLRF
jgi:hypothetical protein